MPGIDLNNENLVSNFKNYIKTIASDTILMKVFNNSADCKKFIFNYIGIDNSNPTFKIDDISFLRNGEKIIGYLVSRIKKENILSSYKISIQEYEFDIPDEFDLEQLKNDYLSRRINSDIEKSDKHEEFHQK
jgi:hypothetical protein